MKKLLSSLNNYFFDVDKNEKWAVSDICTVISFVCMVASVVVLCVTITVMNWGL